MIKKITIKPNLPNKQIIIKPKKNKNRMKKRLKK